MLYIFTKPPVPRLLQNLLGSYSGLLQTLLAPAQFLPGASADFTQHCSVPARIFFRSYSDHPPILLSIALIFTRSTFRSCSDRPPILLNIAQILLESDATPTQILLLHGSSATPAQFLLLHGSSATPAQFLPGFCRQWLTRLNNWLISRPILL